ncbi:MAG: putative dsRNA-binding protein [Faecalibacillus sp.]
MNVNYDDITDFKTKLQELIQVIKERQSHIHYFNNRSSECTEFEVAVMMDDMTLGTGKGSSKKDRTKGCKGCVKKIVYR